MVIITGIGRCGSSLVASFLEEMDFNIGNTVWCDKRKAGKEDGPAVMVNSVLSHVLSAGMKFNEGDIKASIEGICGNRDAIKDPRFTWHPEIIRIWHDVFPDIKVLILLRDFEDSLKSRRLVTEQYPDITWRATDNNIKAKQLKVEFADFFHKVYELRIPSMVMRYPDFVLGDSSYEEMYFSLNCLGLEFDYSHGYEVWNGLINRDLVSSFKGIV